MPHTDRILVQLLRRVRPGRRPGRGTDWLLAGALGLVSGCVASGPELATVDSQPVTVAVVERSETPGQTVAGRPVEGRVQTHATATADQTSVAATGQDVTTRETNASSGASGISELTVRPVAFEEEAGPRPFPSELVDAEFPEPESDAHELPTAAAADRVMTLDELLAIAESRNPTIQQALSVASKARGTRYQVGRRPNPTIGYMAEEIGDNGTAGLQGAYLSQTFVRGEKLEWSQQVAGWEVRSREWQVEAQRLRVANDVRRLYYEVAGAQQRLAVIEDLHEIAHRGVENANSLMQALQASRPDVLQAEIQLQEVEVLRANTLYELEAAWERLASVVGDPHMPRAVVENRLDDPQPVRDRETALSQLMAMSPELRAAHAEVHRARSMISRERAQPIPNVEFQVAALHNAATGDEVANVQVGLPLPLNNRNDGNICRAHAEYQRALWNVERLKLDLQSRLAAAFGQYNAALNQVRIYENEILPRESETLRLIEAAYPIQFDFLRVITARRSYFEAQLEYVTALVNLRQAEVALDGLLLEGGLSGVDDTEIDDSGRSNALSGQ